MTGLPSLRNWPRLREPAVTALFEAIGTGGDEIRIVGGAVRDALIGREPREIDLATTATPAIVEGRAARAGFRVVPTGVEHGSLTVVRDGQSFEVTTLREDVETDGRHAVVRFGRDWKADAERRDFTMNALSVDADGVVHDPVGGYPDVMARRVRFIGDPDRRIAEDRLRLLRLFRFEADFALAPADAAAHAAAIRARNTIRELAPERVANEMRRLVVAGRAPEVAVLMQDSGILPIILGGVGYPGQLRRLADFEVLAGLSPSVPGRLAALAARIAEDADRVASRLRLANAERDAMIAAIKGAPAFAQPIGEARARAARYRLGEPGYSAALAQAAAMGRRPVNDYLPARNHVEGWVVPSFPLSGNDVLAAGLTRGPGIGLVLSDLEAWWIDRGFLPDRKALLERLQQMTVAQQ